MVGAKWNGGSVICFSIDNFLTSHVVLDSYCIWPVSVYECSSVPKMFYGVINSELYILKDVKVNWYQILTNFRLNSCHLYLYVVELKVLNFWTCEPIFCHGVIYCTLSLKWLSPSVTHFCQWPYQWWKYSYESFSATSLSAAVVAVVWCCSRHGAEK